MPELPEVEALRRSLDDPVSAFPIAKAGPAHVATLKTFDPPLSALEGRRLSGAERRAKRLLFPTDDAELLRGLELRERGANDKKTYRVHDHLGEPCYVCGTPIARVDFEEHTIYYCPECQTGGRVLKDRRLSRLLR